MAGLINSLPAQENTPVPIPGQYIITLTEKVAAPLALSRKTSATADRAVAPHQPERAAILSQIAQFCRANQIPEAQVVARFADVLVGFSAKLTPAQVAKLAAAPEVQGVYQDYKVRLETQLPEKAPADIMARGQTLPCAIQQAGGYTIASRVNWIWVLDTGIDLDHPDLNVSNHTPYAATFINGESADDGNGHGTHVAGIAAAKHNNIGIVGVSAGAVVVPVKVLANNGLGSFTTVIQGLNHVAMYNTENDVVNLSVAAFPILNCDTYNPALTAAITNLGASGTWVCIAAGNNAAQAAQCAPGCINGERVVTVGGITCGGRCYSPSNWDPGVVDWVAIASSVYSTYKNGGYATLSGTSQATPVVAGIIHSRCGPPVSGGTVACWNNHAPASAYKIAKRE